MRGEICIGAVTEAEPYSSLSRVAAQSANLKASSFVMCFFFWLQTYYYDFWHGVGILG